MTSGFPNTVILHARNNALLTVIAAGGTLAMNGFTLPSDLNYSGLGLANLRMTIRRITDTSAAVNKLNGAQNLQVNDGTSWQDAGVLPDDSLAVAASTTTYGGTILLDVDIKTFIQTLVASGSTALSLQWLNARADGNNLVLYDVNVELILTFIQPLITS